MSDSDFNEKDLEQAVQGLRKQITKLGKLSGKRKTTRVSKIDDDFAAAIEDAYDIF